MLPYRYPTADPTVAIRPFWPRDFGIRKLRIFWKFLFGYPGTPILCDARPKSQRFSPYLTEEEFQNFAENLFEGMEKQLAPSFQPTAIWLICIILPENDLFIATSAAKKNNLVYCVSSCSRFYGSVSIVTEKALMNVPVKRMRFFSDVHQVRGLTIQEPMHEERQAQVEGPDLPFLIIFGCWLPDGRFPSELIRTLQGHWQPILVSAWTLKETHRFWSIIVQYGNRNKWVYGSGELGVCMASFPCLFLGLPKDFIKSLRSDRSSVIELSLIKEKTQAMKQRVLNEQCCGRKPGPPRIYATLWIPR